MKRMIPMLLALAMLTLSAPAAAQVERCVRNEAELTLAWAVAAASSAEPLVIKLAQGTCDLGVTPVRGDSAVSAGRPVAGAIRDIHARAARPSGIASSS